MRIDNAKIGLLTFCCCFFFISALPGQTWEAPIQIGGNGNESFQGLALDASGNWLFSLNYDAPFSVETLALPNTQGADALLLKLNATGSPIWSVQGGSEDDDQAGPVCLDSEGAIFWGGTFWENAEIAGETLNGTMPGKSLFLLKLDSDGQVLWQKVFSGTGDKKWVDFATDSFGNLYALGIFSDLLEVETNNLGSENKEALLLAKWSEEGELIWVEALPATHSVTGTKMHLFQDILLLTGYQNDSLEVGSEILTAATFDEDGFLLALDTSGSPVWAKSIGAQYNDFAMDLVVNEAQEISVFGHFMGVLRISDDLEVQTPGFNHNIFKATFDLQGNPLNLTAWGGLGEEFVQASYAGENSVLLVGSHEDEFALGNFELPSSPGQRSGFVANFGPEHAVYWNLDIPGEGLVLPQSVLRDENGQVCLVGSFNETLLINDSSYPSEGAFDVFLLKINPAVVASPSIPEATKFEIFPNPTDGTLILKGPLPASIEVVDSTGKIWLQQIQRTAEMNFPICRMAIIFSEFWEKASSRKPPLHF